MMVPNSYQRGFTLLETLVAFAVLALVLAAVFQIFGNGSRSARLVSEYAEATTIAQAVMAESRIDTKMAESGEFSGYRWQFKKAPAVYNNDPGSEVDSAVYNLKAYDLIVTVNWDSGGKERTVSLNSVGLDIEQ